MTSSAKHSSNLVEQAFEAHRRFLWGLSYRMTGSTGDADEIVQEAFVRALEHPPAQRDDGWRAWLARVVMNLSIDALRRRKRQIYVGAWLPAMIETGDEAAPPSYEVTLGEESTEHRYELLESVSIAFLLALEALTPRQRAVLILRDVFDYTLQETAAALNITPVNVKVTHHRARAAMREYREHRVVPTKADQERSAARLREFLRHLQNQDVPAVEAMLTEDVRFIGDGGGEFVTALVPILGRDRVLRLLVGITGKRWTETTVTMRLVNGAPALIGHSKTPPRGWAPTFVSCVDFAPDGRIRQIHTILASAKLAMLGKPVAFA